MKKILLGLTIMAAWGCSQNKPSSDNFSRSPPVSSVASSSTNQDDAADDKHIRVEEVDRDPQWQDDRQRGARFDRFGLFNVQTGGTWRCISMICNTPVAK